jgi:hypothetical protein
MGPDGPRISSFNKIIESLIVLPIKDILIGIPTSSYIATLAKEILKLFLSIFFFKLTIEGR